MKKFLKKIFAFILMIFFLVILIVIFDYEIIGSQYKYSYNASLVDKINRLNSINEPKIILVGNSNLAFGIDSKSIEDAFGMQVVNLGLHAGLGNAFLEEIAKLNINQGDIIIVCHSDYSDTDAIDDTELALLTYDYNRVVFPVFRKKDYIDLLKAYPTYLRKSYLLWFMKEGNLVPKGCYSREAFNEYGDVIYKPEDEQINEYYFQNNFYHLPKISNDCIDRLNEFNRYCNEKGANLVVAGYPIEWGKYNRYSKDDFIDFQNELTIVLDCPVISDYTDYFFPYDYFYNGWLHLNEKGTQARTQQLIEDLRNWMNN